MRHSAPLESRSANASPTISVGVDLRSQTWLSPRSTPACEPFSATMHIQAAASILSNVGAAVGEPGVIRGGLSTNCTRCGSIHHGSYFRSSTLSISGF